MKSYIILHHMRVKNIWWRMYCIVVFCIGHASNKRGFKTMIKNVWQWDAKERPQNQELNIIQR
jgi:hypothetical protein